MTKKRVIYLLAAAVLCTAMLTGGLMMAFADKEGTSSDPLVAKSYIDNVFKPEIMALVDEAVAKVGGYNGDAQKLIDQYSKQIDEKLAGLSGKAAELAADQNFKAILQDAINARVNSLTVTPAANDTFKVITLSSGQKIICGVGCEIMLRIGSAKALGNYYPVFIDITANSEIKSGTALVKNHLYLCTISDNGFQATANNTKVLVRGPYTIK